MPDPVGPLKQRRLTPDDDRPMRELACARCGTTVLVRKNTAAQTSIQWLADAGEACAELAQQRAAGRTTALVLGCGALRRSIEDAVHEGRLEVLEAHE
ncbi:MAG: hypothetical protein NVS3B26_30910 [Mycobacteriales bacterium]